METRRKLLYSLIMVVLIAKTLAASEAISPTQSETRAHNMFDNGLLRSLRYMYQQCAQSEDIYWCSKVEVTKILGRALKLPTINLLDGLSIIRKSQDNETRSGRSSVLENNLSNKDLENLSMKSLDALLFDRFLRFLRSRQIQVNLPRILSYGQQHGEQFIRYIMGFFWDPPSESEGRGKKKGDDKKYLGPFIAAVMLKTAILKMAYHSIAILAGKALIVGKIALIISSIIGLKKLVSSEGGEKTTYEIVKHPQVQQSHTYSSSHAGEYEGGQESGGGGSYHRSIDDEMMMQDKAYNAWVPSTKIS